MKLPKGGSVISLPLMHQTTGLISTGCPVGCILLDMARKNLPLSLEHFKAFAASRGGELLSTEYVSLRKSRLRWRCTAGHEWEASGNSARSGKWCGQCAHGTPYTIEDIRAIAVARGGMCLARTYENLEERLQW